MKNDSRILRELLLLAILFYRQTTIIDTGSMVDFFNKALPGSFFEIRYISYTLSVKLKFSGWDSDENDKVELVYSLIQLGYVLVRNNVNRYKAFIFYQPGVYSRLTAVSELSGPQKVLFLLYYVKI